MNKKTRDILAKIIQTYGDGWWNDVNEEDEGVTNRDMVLDDLQGFLKKAGMKIEVIRK